MGRYGGTTAYLWVGDSPAEVSDRCVAVCGLGDVRYLVQRLRAGGGWWSALNFGFDQG